MSTLYSPADAFASQSAEFAWLHTRAAMQARGAFLRLYGPLDDALDRKVVQEEVDSTLLHLSRETRLMDNGTPVFVTAEVMDLVDEAVEEMPSEVLLHQDLPMDEFVLWFERGIPYHPETKDEHGVSHVEPWDIDAVGVQFVSQSIVVQEGPSSGRRPYEVLYIDASTGMELRDGVMLFVYVNHRNVPREYKPMEPAIFGPYILVDLIGVGFDVDWSTRGIDTPARALHKWIIALMRLMGEHVELRSAGVPRPLRRAAVRAGRKVPEDGYLSILHLREIAYAALEPGETEEGRRLRWKHRVRGHWQRFYCATRGLPVGDAGSYRHRYVNSYVRGPGDRVVESQRVVVVDR